MISLAVLYYWWSCHFATTTTTTTTPPTCHKIRQLVHVRTHAERAGRPSISRVRKIADAMLRCLHYFPPYNSDHRPAPCTSTDERYPHERCMRWYRATDARYLRRSWEHQPQDEKSVLLQVPTSLLDASLPNYVDLLCEQKGLCVVADLGRPREWCNLERGGCIG